MNNLDQQTDEIEALAAIYNDDWQTEDEENRFYSVRIADGDDYVKLYVKLPLDYPLKSPPLYEISAPHLGHSRKTRLRQILDASSSVGETVIYRWIEKLREELQSRESPEQTDDNDKDEIIERREISKQESLPRSDSMENCPIVRHGEVIVDRKSSFQGHAASVFSTDQVKQVLRSLLECRKIKQATHNIYAYRIFREDKKLFVRDCDDDGESQAGGRLLHLLEIVDAKNVLVVVSRWYGGIHLGSDRFRHINNAARQVLQSSGFIPTKHDRKK